MRGLNLDHLRIFLDVIELGSFSAAAQKHGLTQPAVSLQIRQLERRYGLRLAERVGRRVAPTAAGADLLAHIRAIDAEVEQAERSMQAHSTQIVGRVRLARAPRRALICCRGCWPTCGAASLRWKSWPASAIPPMCCVASKPTRWTSAW